MLKITEYKADKEGLSLWFDRDIKFFPNGLVGRWRYVSWEKLAEIMEEYLNEKAKQI